MSTAKTVLTLKPRKLVYISGSVYVALPHDWLIHHNINMNGTIDEKTVQISVDAESRLIIEPVIKNE